VHVDIDNKDKLAAVVELLNTFNKTHREIIMLRIWEDLSYKEISEITGSSVDNCKKIVSRGLKTIQANFVLLLLFIILL
jgi:RNA polymerase sigma factor (sigma-70 family)